MKKIIPILFLLVATYSWSQEAPKESLQIPVEPHEEIFVYPEEEAEFPGGAKALKKFLVDNLVYPEAAFDKGIQGRCFLGFVVSEQGNISNITVRRGVPDCPECDAEAIRVIKLMPKWSPAKSDNKVVSTYYNLPVSIRIPVEENKKQ